MSAPGGPSGSQQPAHTIAHSHNHGAHPHASSFSSFSSSTSSSSSSSTLSDTLSSPDAPTHPSSDHSDSDSDDDADPSTTSTDDDDETQVVFFGKPSIEEEEKRRQYDQRLRSKRLVRRDSLDLARRRTIVFSNHQDHDTDVELDDTICLPQPIDADAASEGSAQVDAAQTASSVDALAQSPPYSAHTVDHDILSLDEAGGTFEIDAVNQADAAGPATMDAHATPEVNEDDEPDASDYLPAHVESESLEGQDDATEVAGVSPSASVDAVDDDASESAHSPVSVAEVQLVEAEDEEIARPDASLASSMETLDEDSSPSVDFTDSAQPAAGEEEAAVNTAEDPASEQPESVDVEQDCDTLLGAEESSQAYADVPNVSMPEAEGLQDDSLIGAARDTSTEQSGFIASALQDDPVSEDEEEAASTDSRDDDGVDEDQKGESSFARSRSIVEEQQAASSSSKITLAAAPASSTPLRSAAGAQGAEAAILLSRGSMVCVPSPSMSMTSFSMDMSPGVGRSVLHPPSDALRRAAMEDILGAGLYRSPATERRDEKVRGSYIDSGSGNGHGRRRSARLSNMSILLSPPKRSAVADGGGASLGKSPERRILAEVTPASQQRNPPTSIDVQGCAKPQTGVVDLEADAQLESPSAEATIRARARSRSQSASPKKRRSKSKSPSKQRHGSPLKSPALSALQDGTPAVASPSVRDVLNAWAGTKMINSLSPEKRPAWLSSQNASLGASQTPVAAGLVPWNMAASLRASTSPTKRTEATLHDLGGQSPTKAVSRRSPVKVAEEPSTMGPPGVQTPVYPVHGELVLAGATANDGADLRRTVEGATLGHSARLDVEASTTDESISQPAQRPQERAQPSTLHAPRIARTLAPGAPETARANRALSNLNRQLGLRKVGDHPDLLASTNADASSSSIPSAGSSSAPPPGATAAPLRKSAAAPASGLPRPAASAASRLPKPASSTRSGIPSIATARSSAAAAPPATVSRLGTKLTSSSALRAAAAQTSTLRASTVAAGRPGASTAPAAPLGASARANIAAAAASTANRLATSEAGADAPPKKRAMGSASRVVPVRSTLPPVRGTLGSSSAASSTQVGRTGQAAGETSIDHPNGANAAAAASAPSLPTLSMLERSQQMQARALARTSPENGDASTSQKEASGSASSDAASGSQPAGPVHVSASRVAPSGGGVSKPALPPTVGPSRVWSPVKAPGSTARLGTSSSPTKAPSAFLVPSSHLRRGAQASSDASLGSSGMASSSSSSQPPPSRFGVPVATTSGVLSASMPATSVGPASTLRGSRTLAKSLNAPPLAAIGQQGLVASTSSLVPVSVGGSIESAGAASEASHPQPQPQPQPKVVRPRVVRATSLRGKAMPASTSAASDGGAVHHATGTIATAGEGEGAASSTTGQVQADTLSLPPPQRKGRTSLRPAAVAASSKIAHALHHGSSSSSSSSLSSAAATTAAAGGTTTPSLLLSSSNNGAVNSGPPLSLLTLSTSELTRLTNQHTRRNGVNVSKLTVKLERREGARPPSPSSKLKQNAGAGTGAGTRTLARLSRRSSSPSFSASSEDEEREKEGRGKRHRLAKGEEEVYSTPKRVRESGKGVRWWRGLVVGPSSSSLLEEGEGEAKTKVEGSLPRASWDEIEERLLPPPPTASRMGNGKKLRSSLAVAKGYTLDRYGNLDESALEPLSPRLRKNKVTIKKIVYDGEE